MATLGFEESSILDPLRLKTEAEPNYWVEQAENLNNIPTLQSCGFLGSCSLRMDHCLHTILCLSCSDSMDRLDKENCKDMFEI